MRTFSPRRLPPYRSAIAATNSSRTAMLTSLIEITLAAYRRGANQMRQQLSVGEHFWRGNASSHPDRRATHSIPKRGPALRRWKGAIEGREILPVDRNV